MKLVETAVTESAVRIRFADDYVPQSWIECQISALGFEAPERHASSKS